MTVNDLIAAAPFCDALEIVVREHGHGKWIMGYRISPKAEQWKAEHTVELQEKKALMYGDKAPKLMDGEIRDVIHGYDLPLRIIKKDISKIPNYIGCLNVCSFQPRHIPSFHRDIMTNNEFSLDINCYPEDFVFEKELELEQPKEAEIDGQMSLFDLEEFE